MKLDFGRKVLGQIYILYVVFDKLRIKNARTIIDWLIKLLDFTALKSYRNHYLQTCKFARKFWPNQFHKFGPRWGDPWTRKSDFPERKRKWSQRRRTSKSDHGFKWKNAKIHTQILIFQIDYICTYLPIFQIPATAYVSIKNWKVVILYIISRFVYMYI
jgi:hypothetical protein